MEKFPPELIIKIFDYIPDNIITVSQVCKYFHLIATTQIKKINLTIERQTEEEIENLSGVLEVFKSIRSLDIKLAYDVNIAEKADFCAIHNKKITRMILSDFSFLNPFFDQSSLIYENLETLHIENSDLTSSSDDLPDFILKSCINLKALKISGCSGLEIESLNKIGKNLCKTKIEKLELHPTYSYFDMSATNQNESWTIENLETLSVRSKLVVMKKNFVRNMLGNHHRKFIKLRKLELIAELNFGENFISVLTEQFPNLNNLAIGKGVIDIHNRDFAIICNFYKDLKSLEFHFSSRTHQDEILDLKSLSKNQTLTDLTLGLTKEISMDHLKRISQCLLNLKKISIILYYLIPSNQEYLQQIIKIFPNVKEITFSHIGMIERIQKVL